METDDTFSEFELIDENEEKKEKERKKSESTLKSDPSNIGIDGRGRRGRGRNLGRDKKEKKVLDIALQLFKKAIRDEKETMKVRFENVQTRVMDYLKDQIPRGADNEPILSIKDAIFLDGNRRFFFSTRKKLIDKLLSLSSPNRIIRNILKKKMSVFSKQELLNLKKLQKKKTFNSSINSKLKNSSQSEIQDEYEDDVFDSNSESESESENDSDDERQEESKFIGVNDKKSAKKRREERRKEKQERKDLRILLKEGVNQFKASVKERKHSSILIIKGKKECNIDFDRIQKDTIHEIDIRPSKKMKDLLNKFTNLSGKDVFGLMLEDAKTNNKMVDIMSKSECFDDNTIQSVQVQIVIVDPLSGQFLIPIGRRGGGGRRRGVGGGRRG